MNRGADSLWARMEHEWATAIEQGKTVEVNMKLVHDDPAMPHRLSDLAVRYSIDGGEPVEVYLENADSP